MPHPDSIPYETYKEETECAIEVCYPIKHGNTLVSAGTVLFEINQNPDKYPQYSQIKLDKKKKLVMTRICLDLFKWDMYGAARGSGKRNSAVYKRRV